MKPTRTSKVHRTDDKGKISFKPNAHSIGYARCTLIKISYIQPRSETIRLRTLMGVDDEFVTADFVLLESLQSGFNARKATLNDFNAIRLHKIRRLVEKEILVSPRRTFSTPSLRSFGKLFEYASARFLCNLTKETICTVCLSLYFSLSTEGGRVTASVPPGARISQPCSCVPPSEIVSKTKSIGEFVIFLTSAATSALRSMTCVAPSDLTRSVLCNDAVTMMGEKPDSFANCIAVHH